MMAKKKEFPTLFDKVCARPQEVQMEGVFTNELRYQIFQARRFVLDDEMSAFLGDLSSVAFHAKNKEAQTRAIESVRAGARLPHKLVWVEYNLRKCNERLRQYNPQWTAGNLSDVNDVPWKEGWLLEQHPKIETAFRARVFITNDKLDEYGFDTWAFPWNYVWCSDDTPLPWKTELDNWDDYFKNEPENPDQEKYTRARAHANLSSLVTGLLGYHSTQVSVQLLKDSLHDDKWTWNHSLELLKEWAGTVRRMWSLLATINDLPILVKDIKQSKGYMARRNYHKFLDHKVITLTVPATEYRRVSRNVIAKVRKRAHQVRGHWRLDFHHPLAPLCEHVFGGKDNVLECAFCKGRKIWIQEHQRGDASLGFVTHDYNVQHKQQETTNG